jgi:hypothetical protein
MDTDMELTQPGDEPAHDGDQTAQTGAEASQPIDDAPKGPQWEERDAWTALDDLDASPKLVPASEWPAGAEGLDRPGLFALWVDEAGATELSRGLELPLEAGRIYVGQAGATKWPSGRANQDILGDRIARTHLTGKVRSSTVRLTLAAILFAQLELVVQASALLQASAEQALSDWMNAHLSVATHPHDDRDTLAGLEQAVSQRLDPPLNIEEYLPPTPERERVVALRRRISREG